MKAMLKAMKISTHLASSVTMPNAQSAKVSECATVKSSDCHSIGRMLITATNNPKMNSM